MLSEYIKYVEYVDFTGNISPSWDEYYTLIRHGCVKKLTLCGDEGMIRYAKGVLHSLNVNTAGPCTQRF